MNNDLSIPWPDGKRFAFTVFDDTDGSTVGNVRDVYRLLSELGFLTTKSVWPVKGAAEPYNGGSTCEDEDYLLWLLQLKNAGFEIALHNVTFHTSLREDTLRGLERFYELFDGYPVSAANHANCLESMYWGSYRLSGIYRVIYNLLTRNHHNGIFRGHIEGDRYFWGDACKDKIKYVRNFVYSDINTLKSCPVMPYHDPHRPLVNYWFASSEGPDVSSFNNCISEQNQDRLEEEGGACIMYTHFANGFYEHTKCNSRFSMLMKRLSNKLGWFVPVSTMLEYIQKVRGHHTISSNERKWLERKWLIHKIKVGAT